MRGIFVAIALSLFAILTGLTALGHETKPDVQAADPTVTTWTKEKIDNPPAREIEFEVLKTVERRKLFRADAKVLEHKYVAQVRLKLPDRRRSDLFREAELSELVRFGDRSIVNSLIQINESRAPSKSLQAISERVPEDQRAKLDELKFFTSDDVDQGYLLLTRQVPILFISDFQILARTKEEAERRATTLVALVDWGVTRPIQLKLLERHKAQAQAYPKHQARLLAAEAELARLQKQLGEYAGVTGEMLGSLQSQQSQLDVDVAGVKARLEACDARLKADAKPEQRAQLEAIKLSAEIELTGCEARRAAAEKLVARVTMRNQVAQDLVKAQTTVNEAKRSFSDASSALINLQHQLDDYQPLPLLENKVIIQPVEWTE